MLFDRSFIWNFTIIIILFCFWDENVKGAKRMGGIGVFNEELAFLLFLILILLIIGIN